MRRVLKIYGQSASSTNYERVPTIIIKGKWLEEFGFQIGEYVEVDIAKGKMSILLTDKLEKKLTFEERIEKLSPEQRKKLYSMIDKQ